MKIKYLITILLLASGCSRTELLLNGPAESVPVGSTFSVDLSIYNVISTYEVPNEPWDFLLYPSERLANVNDIYGVAFDLWYDPAILSVQSIDKSSGLLSTGELQSSFRNAVAGKLVIGLSLVGGVTGITGKGNLLTITFSAVAPGTTSLLLKDIHIYDSTGNKLDASVIINNGTVVIQ